MARDLVERQAKYLAKDNKQAAPDIERVYWFPDDEECRLVELTPEVPIADDGKVQAFYFRASPQDNLPVPSGVALIRPDEFGRLQLPRKWGTWESAVLLEDPVE